MGREGGQALGDRLVVADVGQHPVEHRQARPSRPAPAGRTGAASRAGRASSAPPSCRRCSARETTSARMPASGRSIGHGGGRVEQRVAGAAQLHLAGRLHRAAAPRAATATPRASARSSAASASTSRRPGRGPPDAERRRAPRGSAPPPRARRGQLAEPRCCASTTAMGSTKIVCPEPELSWTMPGTRRAADAFTASTGRPARSVVNVSCRCDRSRRRARERRAGARAARRRAVGDGRVAGRQRGSRRRRAAEPSRSRAASTRRSGAEIGLGDRGVRPGGGASAVGARATPRASRSTRTVAAHRRSRAGRQDGAARGGGGRRRTSSRAAEPRRARSRSRSASPVSAGGRRPRPARRTARARRPAPRPPAKDVSSARRSRTAGSSKTSSACRSTGSSVGCGRKPIGGTSRITAR